MPTNASINNGPVNLFKSFFMLTTPILSPRRLRTTLLEKPNAVAWVGCRFTVSGIFHYSSAPVNIR
jgi:hypothetical protein